SPVTKAGFYLNAGTTVIRLDELANVAFNLKKMQFTASGTGTGPTGPAPVIEWPYGTTQQVPTPIAIPSRIQAEDFDNGGPEVAYHDNTPQNQGDSNHRPTEQVDLCFHDNMESKICYGEVNEWTKYTINVTQTAAYDVTVRYANGCAGNGTGQLLIDNAPIGTFTAAPSSGDWGTLRTTVLSAIPLQAGNHVLKYLNLTGCHDLDYFDFAVNNGTPPPPPPTGSTLTKTLKNVANGMYAYRAGSAILYTSNPDTYGAAAQWTFEDFSGYKRIRNMGNSCLAHIEHLLAYVECDTNTSDNWYSNRWTFTMVGSNYVFNNAWQNTQMNLYNNPSAGVQCTSRGTNSDAQWIYTP
ncbi:MAG TPA: hypothetical protein VNW92_00280, partial [Polyangiaceae bacterium]|nr:hypothetical protein [Polyangiaceae bacterium]